MARLTRCGLPVLPKSLPVRPEGHLVPVTHLISVEVVKITRRTGLKQKGRGFLRFEMAPDSNKSFATRCKFPPTFPKVPVPDLSFTTRGLAQASLHCWATGIFRNLVVFAPVTQLAGWGVADVPAGYPAPGVAPCEKLHEVILTL